MKLAIIASLMSCVLAVPAFADNLSQSGSMAGASVTVNGGKSYRQTGAAIAPGLAVGGLSCAGSTSAAAGGPGWGFAFGTTRMDEDCNHRENAKIADAAFGRQTAKRVLCKIRDIYDVEPFCQRRIVSLPRKTRTAGYPIRRVSAGNGWGQR